MLIKRVALFLEKRNWMQRRKLMHSTYTFTTESSHHCVKPAPKVIVEARLFFSRCLVHFSLSHLWQSMPKYCKILFQWIFICTNAVSLFLLFTRCFGHAILTPQFIQICIFLWQMYLWCLIFSLQSHFYSLPFFTWKVGVSKWWTFSIYDTFQIISLVPIG